MHTARGKVFWTGSAFSEAHELDSPVAVFSLWTAAFSSGEAAPFFLYKFPPSFYKKPWLTTERRASFYLGGDGTGVIHVYWHQLLMSCFHLLHPL